MKLFNLYIDYEEHIGTFSEEFILSDKFEQEIYKYFHSLHLEYSHWELNGVRIASMGSKEIPYKRIDIIYEDETNEDTLRISLREVELNKFVI